MYQRLDDEPDAQALLRTPEISVVSAELSPQAAGLAVHGKDLWAGRVYLQSPLELNRYVEAADAESIFALDRQHRYLMLCQILGARSVEVMRVDRIKSSQTDSLKLGASKAGVGANVSASSILEESLERRLKQNAIFIDPCTDLAQARKHIEHYGLTGDLDFYSLVDLRSHQNALGSYDCEYSLTSSSRSVFKLAANLKFPAVLKIDAGYQSELNEETSIQLRSRITFA